MKNRWSQHQGMISVRKHERHPRIAVLPAEDCTTLANSCQQLDFKWLLIIAILLSITFATGSTALATDIGTSYTVQSGGSIADFGSSAFSRAFCVDHDKSAPSAGFTYTVVSPSNIGLSATTRDQVSAALEGLADGFSHSDVIYAIWYFTDGLSYGGNSGTIINRVNSGAYQPQSVIWLLPESGHLQPMVALLDNPPTPAPTDSPTPTETPTPTPSPTAPPAATPTTVQLVAVGGTIWFDIEDDGLYAPSVDTIFSGVNIELYSGNQDPEQTVPLRTTTTNSAGFYHFDELAEGLYQIHIPSPPNAAPLSSSSTTNQDNDIDNDDNGNQASSGTAATSPVIELRAGQEPSSNIDGDDDNSNLTIDFGFTGPGTIRGATWSDIDRDGIRNVTEDLLQNVEVKLLDPNGNEVLTTNSNSSGEYVLPNVPVGNYVLKFMPPGSGWWITTKDQGDDDSLDSDVDPVTGRSDPFALVAGADLTKDAGFVQMQIGGYAWEDINGDGLQDSTEAGIAGLSIELVSAGAWTQCASEGQTCAFTGSAMVRYGADGFYTYKSATDSIGCNDSVFGDPVEGVEKSCEYQQADPASATVLATTLTDNNGTYRLDSRNIEGGLQPSTAYILRSSLNQSVLNGQTPTKVNVNNGQANADNVDSDAIRVNDMAVINFTSSATQLINNHYDFGFGRFSAKVGGEVWNDLDGTGIQNLQYPNANGVSVLLHDSSGQIFASTESADNGNYSFPNLPQGNYQLEFQAPSSTVWFTLKDQGADEALDSDVSPATGFTDNISLDNDSEINDVDAGLIRGTLGYPPRLPNPGNQISKQNAAVTLILTAIDDESDLITYSASNLPPGLSIGTNSGLISGAPTTVGIYDVSITARDGSGGATTIGFLWTIEELPTMPCAGQPNSEAESGQISGGFAKVVLPDGASRDQHIVVPNGAGNIWDGPSDTVAIYCLNVDTAGRYRILATAKSASDTDGSFFVTVNGSPSEGYLWDIQPSSVYIEEYVSHRGHADPVEVHLSAGQHLIAFAQREDGAQLDKVALELVEEVASTVTCGSLMQEAENGLPHGAFLAYADENASNGFYVAVAEGVGNNLIGGYVQDKIEYCFNVPSDGTYRLQGSILSNNDQSGSFYIKVNGLPDRGYLWDTQVANTFVEDFLNNRGGADPVELYLTAGENRITVYLREDGTKLDKIALVPTPSIHAATALAGAQSIEQAGEEVNVVGTLMVSATFSGEPELAGIRVTLEGEGQQPETVTNQNGRYYFDNVPPGQYQVTVFVPTTSTETVPFSQAVTVHDATNVDNGGANETGRMVEASFGYTPPQNEVEGHDIYLPFLSSE